MCTTVLIAFILMSIFSSSKFRIIIPMAIIAIGFITGDAYVFPSKFTVLILVSLLPYIFKEVKRINTGNFQ